MHRIGRFLRLPLFLLFAPLLAHADELPGASMYANIGKNDNPSAHVSLAAGVRLDPTMFARARARHLRKLAELGLGYDRVQGHNGITADLRGRFPFLGCYGIGERRCDYARYWLAAVPSIGRRWGEGGLHGFAGIGPQLVFSPIRDQAWRVAIGFQHRFPFSTSLRADNAVTLELRFPGGFSDPAPPPPPPRETKNPFTFARLRAHVR